MVWVDQLRGQVVGLDTAPIIYFVEENPTYLDRVTAFFESIATGDFRAVTSLITLLEVLVHPYRTNNEVLAAQYRNILLNSEGITVLPVSRQIADESARLRARYNLRTPDSIQMATAITEGAQFLLTNDSELPSLPNLQVLVLDNLE